MADDVNVKIELAQFRTKKQEELLKLLDDKKVQKQVNVYIKDAINPFVPMKSGKLRRSARVTHKTITWGNKNVPYARYQYGGIVYGPNYPGIEAGGETGWRSSRGKGSKHPTGRELGVPGMAILHPVWKLENGRYIRPGKGITAVYKFGYTTSGTRHHWGKAFEYEVKRRTNLDITRFLKKECKRRGLNK